MLKLVLAFNFLFLVTGALWNATTDPLPPLQPPECGYNTFTYGISKDSQGNIVADYEVNGYYFSSLAYQFIETTATGSNYGVPVFQLSFTNYTYSTQSCSYQEVEGNWL